MVTEPAMLGTDVDLLLTRVHLPLMRTRLVERIALQATVRRGLAAPLLLVCAPAGFGKTTAVAQVLHADTIPTAWLALDPGDNDVPRFWRYLLAAFEHARPGIWAPAHMLLQSTAAHPAEPLVTALLNAVARDAHPLVLVLDDYHLITAPPIHAALTTVIERAPPNLHIVLLSRTLPLLPLERWRVRGLLVDVPLAQLRFDVGEAAALLHDLLGAPLPTEIVQTLVARTDGWGAGLILAALAAHGRSDLAHVAASFGGASPELFAYVVHEVVAHQPPAVQALLLRTAALPQFSAELCAALSDPPLDLPTVHALLDQIERAQLFLVPLDDERRWFRYHQLFAEGLRAYAERSDPTLLQTSRQRAATWLAHHGWPSDAIQLALAAEDWPLAAELIGLHGRTALLRSEVITVQHWLAALPHPIIQAHPPLLLLDGWVKLLLSRLDDAAAQATSAVQIGGNHITEALFLQAMVTILRGDHRTPELPPDLAPQGAFLHMIAALNTGFRAQFAGDVEAAIAAFRDAERLSRSEAKPLITFITLCQIGEVQITQGLPRAAEATFRAALAFVHDERADQAIFRDVALVGLGLVAYELGAFEQAHTLLMAGLAQRSVLGDLAVCDGRLCLADLAVIRGELAAAEAALADAHAAAARLAIPFFVDLVAAHAARIAVRTGKREQAQRWLASPAATVQTPLALVELVTLVRAEVLFALGQPTNARDLLDRIIPAAAHAGRGRVQIEALLLRARVFVALGQRSAARADWLAAQGAAEAAGLVAVLVESGATAELFADPTWPAGLTEREVEVLQMIHAGLSNHDIAAQLVIAPSTVKKHINRIFAKLDVSSRTQALAQARNFGLL
jgi:LuxR family maltose regulon positive regulatory protein